jgi:hypothetical protein
MTPVERAAMRSLIAELTLARQEIRRLKARQAALMAEAKRADKRRLAAVDQGRYLHGVLTAKGLSI